jgi:hypothetical protein
MRPISEGDKVREKDVVTERRRSRISVVCTPRVMIEPFDRRPFACVAALTSTGTLPDASAWVPSEARS